MTNIHLHIFTSGFDSVSLPLEGPCDPAALGKLLHHVHGAGLDHPAFRAVIIALLLWSGVGHQQMFAIGHAADPVVDRDPLLSVGRGRHRQLRQHSALVAGALARPEPGVPYWADARFAEQDLAVEI